MAAVQTGDGNKVKNNQPAHKPYLPPVSLHCALRAFEPDRQAIAKYLHREMTLGDWLDYQRLKDRLPPSAKGTPPG